MAAKKKRRTPRVKPDSLDSFKKLNESIRELIGVLKKASHSEEPKPKTDGKKPKSDKEKQKERDERKKLNWSEGRRRYEKNKEKAADYSDLGDYFKFTGKTISTTNSKISGFGKVVAGLGSGFSKLGKVTTKLLGPWGQLAVLAIEMVGKMASAIAQADKRQQDIQNRRNTLLTERNIELSNIESEGYVDAMESAFAKGTSMYTEKMTEVLGLQAIENQKALANASAQINGVIGDINAAAWERLAAETDIRAEEAKLRAETARVSEREQRSRALTEWGYRGRTEERKFQQENVLLNTEAESAKLNLEAVRNAAEHGLAEATNYAVGAMTGGGGIYADNVYGDPTGRYKQAYGSEGRKADENRFEGTDVSTKIAGAAIAGAANDITSLVGINLGSITDAVVTKQETVLGRDITNATNELKAATAQQTNFFKVGTSFYENSTKALDQMSDDVATVRKAAIETQAQIDKMFQKMAQTVEQWAMNYQKSAYNTGIGMGLTDRTVLDTYTLYMTDMVSQLSRQFGMNANEVLALQSGYETEGRNIFVDSQGLEKLAGLAKYLGGDSSIATQLASNTERFNMGVSETMDIMGEMVKRLNKMGLDGQKYLKNMTNYVKQANKYTFKDGVKGIAEMAKWAQNVRFNMDSVPQIVESIQSGGLENIITKAAKMQVLGGRYAMFADPLAMYYEAYNDPEALAKRYNEMIKGMGRFNSKTGNVDFGQVEQELMRAFAEASGQALEDVRAQATYNVKRFKVTSINQDLSKEQQQALVNRAYYEDGEWKVNTVTGGKMSVRDVNQENFRNVQGGTHEEKMEKGMERIVAYVDRFSGQTEGQLNDIARGFIQSGKFTKEMSERLGISEKNFRSKIDEYIETTQNLSADATKAYTDALTASLGSVTTVEEETLNAIHYWGHSIVGALMGLYDETQYKTDSTLAKHPSEYRDGKNRGEPVKYQSIGNDNELSVGGESAVVNENSSKSATAALNPFAQQLQGILDKNYSDRYQPQALANAAQSGETVNYLKNELAKAKQNISDLQQRKNELAAEFDKKGNERRKGSIAYQDRENDKLISKAKDRANDLIGQLRGYGVDYDYIQDGLASVVQSDPQDRVIHGNGKPVLAKATKVKPVKDGLASVVQSDPQDTAIFAKDGGPFDTLFNGVFSRIDDIWNSMDTTHNTQQPIKGELSLKPLEVRVSGNIRLEGNGQSYDISQIVNNNPIFIRQLTQMINDEIGKSINGGKSIPNAWSY